MCLEAVPYSLAQLYISSTIGVSANYACIPLWFEYAAMVTHPVPEGIVAAFMIGECTSHGLVNIK